MTALITDFLLFYAHFWDDFYSYGMFNVGGGRNV